jgi:hypothetical protein
MFLFAPHQNTEPAQCIARPRRRKEWDHAQRDRSCYVADVQFRTSALWLDSISLTATWGLIIRQSPPSSWLERTNNGSDHVHKFEVLPFHVAPEQALRIRGEFKKPAVKLVSELSTDRPDRVERLSDKRSLFRRHDGNRRNQKSARQAVQEPILLAYICPPNGAEPRHSCGPSRGKHRRLLLHRLRPIGLGPEIEQRLPHRLLSALERIPNERGAHGASGRAAQAHDLEFLVDSGLEQGLHRARRERRFRTAALTCNGHSRFHFRLQRNVRFLHSGEESVPQPRSD